MPKSKQHGLTLIETLMVIAIIAGVIVFSTRLFVNARLNTNVTATISQIKQAVQAGYQWINEQPQTDFNGNANQISINKLINAHLLEAKNQYGPWPNSILTVSPDPDQPDHLRIALNNIPASACTNLRSRMQNSTIKQISAKACGKRGNAQYYGVF